MQVNMGVASNVEQGRYHMAKDHAYTLNTLLFAGF